ncbi:MAG: hypothetical protein SPJ29_06235 [Phocaeicola sp.]|nr:hypothetical protein [Phocaeicola sp.]MDD7449212.1 hypothetical protein [Prevotellaceae bacterium]MDY3915052.1 hypothetical protein [Phocaeicola sp.]MDY5939336.1 hypothetical protein [Phocaeicola sp.]
MAEPTNLSKWSIVALIIAVIAIIVAIYSFIKEEYSIGIAMGLITAWQIFNFLQWRKKDAK